MAERTVQLLTQNLVAYPREPSISCDPTDLRKSIQAYGILKPIVAVAGDRPDAVRIIDGLRRHEIANELGINQLTVTLVSDYAEALNNLPPMTESSDELQVPWDLRPLHMAALYWYVISDMAHKWMMEQRRTVRINKGVRVGSPRAMFRERMGLNTRALDEYSYALRVLAIDPRPPLVTKAIADIEAGRLSVSGLTTRVEVAGLTMLPPTTQVDQAEVLDGAVASMAGLKNGLITMGAIDMYRYGPERRAQWALQIRLFRRALTQVLKNIEGKNQ